MKTHIAQDVNIAQLEEVTQLTVNRIIESSFSDGDKDDLLFGKENQPISEREGGVTLSLDLLQTPAP